MNELMCPHCSCLVEHALYHFQLASRMTSIINAELLAIFSIPLFASLMARGVWFQQDMPWQLGAAPVALALGGLGYKYINEALTWQEDDDAAFSEEPSAKM